MMKPLMFLAAVLGCGLLSSCSVSFDRDWRTAVAAGPKPGVEGAWSGTWQSEATGHTGKLRCVVGPAQKSEHDFHYHATWSFLSGAYHAKHLVTQTATGSKFQGQHRMPDWAGGLYTYQGTIQGDDFHAKYQCAKDRGSYTMKRVRP
jgi:hypothetical protein